MPSTLNLSSSPPKEPHLTASTPQVPPKVGPQVVPAKEPTPQPGLILGRAYLVDWIDSAFLKGWQYPTQDDDLPQPRHIQTLGWLVAGPKNHIVLSPSRTEDNQGFLNPLAIPRGCIQNAQEVPSA